MLRFALSLLKKGGGGRGRVGGVGGEGMKPPPILGRDALEKEGKSLMWIGNVYPIKRSKYDLRWLWYDDDLTHSLPPLFPSNVHVEEVYPRLKEGGAIVCFRPKNPDLLAYFSIQEVGNEVLPHLLSQFSSTFRDLPRVNTIIGEPFYENLSSLLPTQKIKIQFLDAGENPDGSKRFSPSLVDHPTYTSFGLSPLNYTRFDLREAEPLYSVLSKYGSLSSLEMFTSPPPKDTLPYAVAEFTQLESAISARSCLHRAPFPKNLSLHISYLPVTPTHSRLYTFISSNTRLSVFVVALLATVLTYFLFDPLRQLNILRRLLLTTPLLSDDEKDEFFGMSGAGGHSETTEHLTKYFNGEPDTVLIVTGPVGVGKSRMVLDTAQKNGSLLIKIGKDVHSGEQMIDRFVKGTGYFPSYGLSHQMGNLVDSLVPGSKASSLNPTIDNQLTNILMCVRKALRHYSYFRSAASDNLVPVIVIEGMQRLFDEMDPKVSSPLSYALCDFTRRAIKSGKAHVVFITDNNVEAQKLRELFAQSSLAVDHVMVEDPSEDEVKDYLRKKLFPLLSEKKEDAKSFYDWLWSWSGKTEKKSEKKSDEKSDLDKREGDVKEGKGMAEKDTVKEKEGVKEKEAGKEKEGEGEGKREGDDHIGVVVELEKGVEALSVEEEKEKRDQVILQSVLSTCGCRPRDIERVIKMIKGGRTLEDTLAALILRAIQDWRNRVLPPYAKHCSYYELMQIVKELCEKDFISYDQILYNIFEGDSSKLSKLITNDIIRTVTFRTETGIQTYVTTSSQLQLVALRLLMKDKALRERVVKIVISQETKLLHEKAKYLEEELKNLSEMIYRLSKSGNAVDTKVLVEREKSVLAILQKIITRQQLVEDLAKWDPSKEREKEIQQEPVKRRLIFF